MQQPYFPAVFDSSMLASFKSCPQLFYKTYIQEWKPKGLSVHLHAGKSFARGLEVARKAFYLGEHEIGRLVTDPLSPATKVKIWTPKSCEKGNSDYSIAVGLQALLFDYGDFICPADSAKSAERMAGAFEFYFSNYPLDQENGPIELPGDKFAIEFSFAHPLPIAHPVTGDPILYAGRMDAINNYAGGKFICDEKTTTQLGASWSRQWDLRAQFTGYAWGCQQAGIHVDGAIVRGVSILKTKYETQQAISYRPEWQIDRWYEEMLDWIADIAICAHNSKWRHNLDHACAEFGGCAFRQACSSQEEAPWLETYFEKRHWDPIMREEKLL